MQYFECNYVNKLNQLYVNDYVISTNNINDLNNYMKQSILQYNDGYYVYTINKPNNLKKIEPLFDIQYKTFILYVKNIDKYNDFKNVKTKILDMKRYKPHFDFSELYKCYIETFKKCFKTINGTNNLLNKLIGIYKIPAIKKEKLHTKLINKITQNIKYIESINIKPINLQINEKIINSQELYFSHITQTDWTDELNDNNPFGLLIRTKSGLITNLGYNLNDLQILSITNAFIPVNEYLEAAKIYYDKYNIFDSGHKEPLIDWNGIGSGNSILPLYINECHWSIMKNYINPLISLCVSNYPFDYCNKYNEIYLIVIYKLIEKLNTSYSDILCQILFSVIRTFKEFKYNFPKSNTINIQNITNDYIDNIIIYITYLTLTEQLNDNTINLLFEEYVRQILNKVPQNELNILDKVYCYNNINELIDYTKYIMDNDINTIKLNELDKLMENDILKQSFDLFNYLIKFNKLYHSLDISYYDSNYCVLTNDTINCIKHFKFNSSLNKEFIYACLIQGILQKNNKKRKQSFNTQYISPINYKKVILNCGNLIVDRKFNSIYFNYKNDLIQIINSNDRYKFIGILDRFKNNTSILDKIMELDDVNNNMKELYKSIFMEESSEYVSKLTKYYRKN